MRTETYRQALKRAFSLLQTAGHNPQIAEWFCLHLCGCSKAEWLARLDWRIPTEEASRLTSWVERVLAGEPYQYIIGVQDFYGREFQVSPAVLIPRPETEVLVEQVLQKVQEIWPSTKPLTGVDVGTGSGVIAITLDLEVNQAGFVEGHKTGGQIFPLSSSSQVDKQRLQMVAVDISVAALEVAQANAKRHQSTVTFMPSDLLEALQARGKQVDFIVSNPPYIPFAEKEKLDRNVIDFEPHLALFAEEDGLYFYREIIKQARHVLNTPGLLAFEVGMGQAQAVSTLIQGTFPQATCAIKKDLSGIERMVLAIF